GRYFGGVLERGVSPKQVEQRWQDEGACFRGAFARDAFDGVAEMRIGESFEDRFAIWGQIDRSGSEARRDLEGQEVARQLPDSSNSRGLVDVVQPGECAAPREEAVARIQHPDLGF